MFYKVMCSCKRKANFKVSFIGEMIGNDIMKMEETINYLTCYTGYRFYLVEHFSNKEVEIIRYFCLQCFPFLDDKIPPKWTLKVIENKKGFCEFNICLFCFS
jgi:hypothetical protein